MGALESITWKAESPDRLPFSERKAELLCTKSKEIADMLIHAPSTIKS